MKGRLTWIIFGILIVGFVIIESKGLLMPQPGDENVYFYMGSLLSKGVYPYRDFFYAHPPLHLLLLAAIFKLFGFNIVALKLLPIISILVTALILFLIVREKFGNLESIVASVLFLFSYSVLFNSVFAFGISTATMLMVAGLYFYSVKKNNLFAGLFFGLAGLTRLLALIPFLIIAALLYLNDKKKIKKIIYGFSITFIIANILLIALFGNRYINDAYKYHFLKKHETAENFKEYVNVVKLNWVLFGAALLSIFIKDKNKSNFFALISLIAVAFLIFLALSSRIFNFYFIVGFPFLAVLGGVSLSSLLKAIRARKMLIVTIVVLMAVFIWDTTANIAFLHSIAFKGFSRGNEIVSLIDARLNPEIQLFGDDSTSPLIALMTKRSIIFNIVDTNPAVFKTGIIDLDDTLNKLKGNKFIFIIRSKQGISEFVEVRNFLDERCAHMSTFSDKSEGSYLVYDCK